MRIALLNIDSLASNPAIRIFIERNSSHIALLGLSPPFNARRGGILRQSRRHLVRSGIVFSYFMFFNFLLPRALGSLRPVRATLAGLAQERGIRVERLEDVNDGTFARLIGELGIDLVISCYFDQIIRDDVIALPRLGVFNVHSSMLPMHRGPMPVLHGCLDQPPQLGITLHRVDAGIDTGPILAQRAYAPPPRRSVLTLTRELHVLGVGILETMLPAIEAGSFPSSPQDGGSYESFPDRAAMRRLLRSGRLLFDHRDIACALRTPMSI